MTIAATPVVDTLRTHPWVAQVAATCLDEKSPGVALLPTATGITALCERGRRAFVQALTDHLAEQGHHAPSQWRLCDDWPDHAGAAWVEARLNEQRPTQPRVLSEQQHGEHIELMLWLPLDLAYFDVHFPRLPILPGVVQLGWALTLGAARLGTPRTCRRMEMLKFQSPLRPGDQVRLSLRHDPAQPRLHFSYSRGDAECSSGRMVWESADG